MSDEKLCRGCGGTGLDHSLPPRTYQVAMCEITLHKSSPGKSVGVARLRISNEPHKARLAFDGPLVFVLAEIDRLRALGYYTPEHVMVDIDMACEWCHGTGVPQLSIRYLDLLAHDIEKFRDRRLSKAAS